MADTPSPRPLDPTTARRGFTLIELLVVIGIIALLIGILLPVLANARITARDAVCLQNLKQLVTAVHTYATDSREVPRAAVNLTQGPQARDLAYYGNSPNPWLLGATNDLGIALWLMHRQDYVTTPEVYVTPGLENHQPDPMAHGAGPRGQLTFTNISGDYSRVQNLSYGYHNVYYGENGFGGGVGNYKFTLDKPEANADFALLADRGPACCGSADNDLSGSGEAGRSNVHLDGDTERGQHVAFADGHASFEISPAVGPLRSGYTTRDLIYFDYNLASDGVPTTREDVVIGPVLYADR